MNRTTNLCKFLLLTLLMLVVSMTALAQKSATLVSLTFNNEKATSALRKVEKASGAKIQYNYEDINFKVTLNAKNKSALAVVNEIISGHGLKAEANGDYIVIVKESRASKHDSDSKTVAGLVVDEKGEPVIGATVRNRSGKLTTLTDINGNFSIPSDADRVTLDVTYMGMKPASWSGNRGDYCMVVLKDASQQLEDVVVTGYQQLDRRNLTSSVVSKDMSELEIAGVSDLSKMLEGKIPDLVSLTNSGEVNSTTKIRIRGTSTLVGNREPLWVVDGIILTDPVELSSDVLNDPDYVNRIGNAIAGINPQDIQRVDVLKDAAATALYGTRAANGVIVITTKSGREGKPIISYNAQLTARRRPYYTDSKVNLMDSAERITFSQYLAEQHYRYPSKMPKVGYEYALNQLYTNNFTPEEFAEEVDKMSRYNTDWFDILCHNSFSMDHSVNVSGGSERVRYYASLGYTDQDDVVKLTDNKRYTAMAKVDMTLSDKFKLGVNINGYLNDRNYSAGNVNLIDYAYNTSRAIPAYNADGSRSYYKKYGNQDVEYVDYNILTEADNSRVEQRVSAVTATFNLRYQANDNLFFNGVFSVNKQNSDITTVHGENSFYSTCLRLCSADEVAPFKSYMPYGGEYQSQTSSTLGWTSRLQGNYNRYFGKELQHNINVAVGLEASSTKYDAYEYTQRCYYKDRGKTFATNISTDYYNYWAWMQSNVPQITDNLSNMISVYATLSYSYKSLFTLNVNGRYDGSNQFGSRSKENLLPIWSLSGNANLMNIFKLDYDWLNTLMVKSSYGEQGNMLSGQTTRLVIKNGSMDAYYNENVSTPVYFANPDLRWEKTKSFNVGLEASVLNNRLQLEVEYYHKKTTDAFLSKTISDVNGFNSYVVNSGIIDNSGFNTTITATPIRTKDFYWILSGNVSRIYNTVKTAPGAETYELSDFLNGTAVIQGQPVGTFFSYNFLGLSPKDGGPIFEDWQERQAEISESSNYDVYTKVLVASGKREPDVTGSFSSTFTYKNWRLAATFLYSMGAKTRLFRLFDGFTDGYSSEQNINRALLDRWMKPGDEQHTNIPSIMGTNTPGYFYYSSHWSGYFPWTGARLVGTDATTAWTMYDYSTARVVSADYLKLSTLSLTYEVHQKTLDRLGLSRLAFTASAYNLKTWCDKALRGQTPSQGGFSEVQLSDTPSFTIGISANF